MRYTPGEKLEIIRLVEGSDLPIRTTLERLGVSRASFYRWYRAYVDQGIEGLAAKPSSRRQIWNRIPDDERERVVEVALAKPARMIRIMIRNLDPVADLPAINLDLIRAPIIIGERLRSET